MAPEGVVYAKDCLDHAATVVDYLARYTYRIAISNARILDIDAKGGSLRYCDHDRTKVLRLEGEEFVRRFLLHILPKELIRVRHCGFLANRSRVGRVCVITVLRPRPSRTDILEHRR